MNKTIKVIKCDVIKEGKSDKTGKEWVLYKVFVEGDPEMKEFTTFNSDFMGSNGQQMQVNVAYNDKFKNYQEVSQKQEAEQGKHEEIMNALRQVFGKLDDLENLINAINAKVTGDIGSVPEGPSNIKEDSE